MMNTPQFKFNKGDFVRINGHGPFAGYYDNVLGVVQRGLGWVDGHYRYSVVDVAKRVEGGAYMLQAPEHWLTLDEGDE
jgi:hypothetical protein